MADPLATLIALRASLPRLRQPRRQREAPENDSQGHQDYTAVLEKAGEQGLDEPAVLAKVINQKSWADFEKLGGNAEIAQKRLDAWVEKNKA